jgi:hypothetical protein
MILSTSHYRGLAMTEFRNEARVLFDRCESNQSGFTSEADQFVGLASEALANRDSVWSEELNQALLIAQADRTNVQTRVSAEVVAYQAKSESIIAGLKAESALREGFATRRFDAVSRGAFQLG